MKREYSAGLVHTRWPHSPQYFGDAEGGAADQVRQRVHRRHLHANEHSAQQPSGPGKHTATTPSGDIAHTAFAASTQQAEPARANDSKDRCRRCIRKGRNAAPSGSTPLARHAAAAHRDTCSSQRATNKQTNDRRCLPRAAGNITAAARLRTAGVRLRSTRKAEPGAAPRRAKALGPSQAARMPTAAQARVDTLYDAAQQQMLQHGM